VTRPEKSGGHCEVQPGFGTAKAVIALATRLDLWRSAGLRLGAIAIGWASIGSDGGIKGEGMWPLSGGVIAFATMPPVGTEAEGEADADASNHASHHHRLRVSRLLDLTRLRTAPPEERIAALRQLREQSQQESAASPTTAAAAAEEQEGRSAGLTSRLRDKFRIRTRTQASE
jgi:hypothetical protein